jgi:hypothetical protein
LLLRNGEAPMGTRWPGLVNSRGIMLLAHATLMDEIARRSLSKERARHARAVTALDPGDRPAVVAEAERHRDRIDDIVTRFGSRLASRHPTPPLPPPPTG